MRELKLLVTPLMDQQTPGPAPDLDYRQVLIDLLRVRDSQVETMEDMEKCLTLLKLIRATPSGESVLLEDELHKYLAERAKKMLPKLWTVNDSSILDFMRAVQTAPSVPVKKSDTG